MTLNKKANWIIRTRRSRTSGGFTLVEMIAVMVIVAILAVTAAPVVHSMTQSRQAAAAKQLLRDLSYARQHAQATGTRTWVVFDLTAQTWTVKSDDSDDPGPDGAITITDSGTGREMTRQMGEGPFAGVSLASVGFGGGGSEVGFDWLGRPLRADGQVRQNPGTITLSGGHSVKVEARTGYATYEQ